MLSKRLTEFSRTDIQSYGIATALRMFYTSLNVSILSVRGDADEQHILLGYDAVWNGEKLPTLCKSLLPPSSGL
jgi:hypothetical protein